MLSALTMVVQFTPSFDPNKLYLLGSRASKSLAVVNLIPCSTCADCSLIVKPALARSKFKYFVDGSPSIAYSAVSPGGLFVLVGVTETTVGRVTATYTGLLDGGVELAVSPGANGVVVV